MAWYKGLQQGLAALLAYTSLTLAASAATAQIQTADGYEILAGGEIVRDPKTELEWIRCSVGQKWDGKTCTGKASTFYFESAQQEVKAFNQRGDLAGKTDWRLPAIGELASLIHCSSGKMSARLNPKYGQGNIANSCDGDYQAPTIGSGAFPKTQPGDYWSRSLDMSNAEYGFYVGFDNGRIHYGYVDPGQKHLRLVRASQPSQPSCNTAASASGAEPAPASQGKNSKQPQTGQCLSAEPERDPAAVLSANIKQEASPSPRMRKAGAPGSGARKAASHKESPRPSVCADLSNGDAVWVAVKGQPQPQSAMVLEAGTASVTVRVMGNSVAAGRKLSLPCTQVLKKS